ncbi:MAG: alkaline phosphatase family protein, partial [Flavisolibacter sp.]
FTKDSAGIMNEFWNDDVVQRRAKLFPFLWSRIAQHGQIYGSRMYGNYANVMNRYKFSYPGYNEIFTGYPDTAVNSNDKILNQNINVLEFINQQKEYKGKVAAFTSWDVFPYILNAGRSGIYVNADLDTLRFKSSAFALINDLQFLTSRPLDVRPDVFTYIAAREYLKAYKPKLLYIAFDETDDFAHEGLYDQYLKSAHAEDAMIADLWRTLQSMKEYRDKTTLIVTCDHGRGDKVKKEWTSHGTEIAGADEIWMAFLGRGIESKGEIKEKGQVYQAQLAQTIAALLGLNFKANHPIQKSISSITAKHATQ